MAFAGFTPVGSRKGVVEGSAEIAVSSFSDRKVKSENTMNGRVSSE